MQQDSRISLKQCNQYIHMQNHPIESLKWYFELIFFFALEHVLASIKTSTITKGTCVMVQGPASFSGFRWHFHSKSRFQGANYPRYFGGALVL